jgi:23S rRNA (uracil1939-C5)-methyltransferase
MEFSPVKLVYGGEALGYAEGKTLLVSGVLPGERAEVEAESVSKGVTHARPLRVLETVPERVAPRCPNFGLCGGCHYQHIDPARQTAWKVEILRETLRRIGKIRWDSEIPAHQAEPWNYRNQAELKIALASQGWPEIGFFQSESHRLVGIDECLILSPRLNQVLKRLRDPERLDQLAGLQAAELLASDGDDKVAVTLRGRCARDKCEHIARSFLAEIAGVVSVTFDDGRSRRTFGEPALIYRVSGVDYRISPGSFFQASRFLIPDLVKTATSGAGGALALDFYAGVGLFSLVLARQFERVVAVESNPTAARDLEANARSAGARNLRVAAESAYDFLRRFAQPNVDFVLLDPPRAGLGKLTLERLAHLRPKRVHYVSCHPPTWARDIGLLCGRGYRLEAIEMFDFFPQTYHIEALARLTRGN